jgi:integrase
MATIRERTDSTGRKRYRAMVRLKGFQDEYATFDRKTDARRWAQKTEAAMKEGRHFKSVLSKTRTLGNMVDRYLQDIIPTKEVNSQRTQTTQLLWWKERLGNLALADVTPAIIGEARDELARGITRSGTPRSPSTVTRYMAPLSHCFTIAMKEWGWIDDTPMRKVTKPKEPKGRMRFLSDDERDRLLHACQESGNLYLHTIVVLAIVSGMRRSEIMNLTWDKIDLKRSVVTLQPEDTKNNEARAVPLSQHVLQMLKGLEKVRRIDTNLAFPAPADIERTPKPIDIQSAWKGALRRADIKDFRFHDLRHTAASYLAMNGATLAEIAEVLGHKTLQMVKRYSHLTEAHTSKVVEKMSSAVFG